MTNIKIEPSSYKDKDAYVYTETNEIYRKINPSYFETYNKLIDSGLYNRLVNEKLLVSHETIEETKEHILIKPEKVFISYPWEWSFSQIKDAAILTLKIQKIALEYNMSLKDANFFNVQFVNNKPIFIDTTSFELYIQNQPWVAYKQFCENFIAPLALMAYKDLNLKKLIIGNIQGLSLKLTSKLLPLKTWFSFNLLTHIHLHSKMYDKQSFTKTKQSYNNFSKNSMTILIDNLIETIKNIKLSEDETEWGNYYENTNYSEQGFELKKNYIIEFTELIKPQNIIDFGSNTGVFSRLVAKNSSQVYALDIDELAIEKNYLQAKKNEETNIFPLVYDIMNPSPYLGFFNKERKDLKTRLNNVDLVLALALVHHLAITYNVPFERIAEFFASWGKYLIIEYINKNDSKLTEMLTGRKDIFSDYTEENFEKCFSQYYKILDKKIIESSERILYFMERK